MTLRDDRDTLVRMDKHIRLYNDDQLRRALREAILIGLEHINARMIEDDDR